MGRVVRCPYCWTRLAFATVPQPDGPSAWMRPEARVQGVLPDRLDQPRVVMVQ